MVTEKVLPPILKPFLYGVVCLILESTQLSGAPKPASGPVSGWIQPSLMAFVVLDTEPLMPELHASSSPPTPMTAAPAPTARRTPRRLTPPTALKSPDCTLWSLICHRSPCEVMSQRRDRAEARQQESSGTRESLVAGCEALIVCAWRTAMRNTTTRNADVSSS